MEIKKATLHITEMPLVIPFTASYGTYEKRESIVIELEDTDGYIGFGEVVAFSEPWYTEETVKTALHVLQDFLLPDLLKAEISHPNEVPGLFQHIKRNRMAKAGIEGAVWDLYAKRQKKSLATLLGGTRTEIEVGVVIGINTTPVMLKQIEKYAEEGYERFKVKIKPEHDYELLKEIRKEFPHIPLMADANSAYTLADTEKLKRLDEFQLMMIEQPLADYDFLDHAQLQKKIETPICLDESIHSLEDARVAIMLGSCQIVNIKPGRVGGLTESIQIHDYCMEHNIPVWCGGMVEMGISRAQNVALASLPNFTIPGDISASSRHWERDIISPEVMLEGGKVTVPQSVEADYEVDRGRLAEITKQRIILER
ncbi:o-succinylbenzoate synthase [Bacillus albus]|uniref:o-succinylbenzoate synthase n=1 Tax=Bacillus albus TaxID=2026189 RepID=UPI001009AF1C|nr:o-succinylbenzoate synthase [Bacillus albus]RXJ15172.1 o-succinylbenzoate synthase [Bacillus albus]RXJ24191.1 o-succinylbenzoate synthase [Bacillus albus]RXJ25910.1 o-succinylbenzoate synthase [Bacillus albus]RXJ37516.1 o-succinylbenzoate synthase [Bacillus albus]RXJ53654.1 o-succinylbenzoate synthase [Bacillus albus]